MIYYSRIKGTFVSKMCLFIKNIFKIYSTIQGCGPIKLSGDELSNIVSNADFTEETAEPDTQYDESTEKTFLLK